MSMISKPGIAVRGSLLCLPLGGPIIPLMAWSDEGDQIDIYNFKFSPNPLTIREGTQVTWTIHDDTPHSIVLNALGVYSKAMDTDGTMHSGIDRHL